MDKYEKIKRSLIKDGVYMPGFAGWLRMRQTAQDDGFANAVKPVKNQLGTFPYELQWERAYQKIAKQTNVLDFSDWLLGLAGSGYVKNWGRPDPFTSIGIALQLIGTRFASLFRH